MDKALKDGASTAARSDTFEWLARLGWAVKGLVHGMVGVLALMWAVGEGNGETTDPRGAVGAIGSGPLSVVLMGVVCAGLATYALWRFAQAALDLDNRGKDLSGIARRLAYAGIGLAYALLAATATSALLQRGDGPAGETDFTGWTAFALALPAGPWIVGLAGAGTIAAALVQFYRAYSAPFLDYWEKDEDHHVVHRWGSRVSRVGLAARGVVFAVVGWFLLRAAWRSDAGEARNLGEALFELSPEPWILGLVAVGLIAFGVHCFLNAKYRHINDSRARSGGDGQDSGGGRRGDARAPDAEISHAPGARVSTYG